MYRLPSTVRASRRRISLGFAAFGTGTLGVAAALPLLHVPKDWAALTALFGFCAIAFGLICYVLSWVWPRDKTEAFFCRFATEAEIGRLLQFAATYMGPVQMPSEQHLQNLLRANPELYYIVEKQDEDDVAIRHLVGCFTILPLKQGVVTRLEDAEVHGPGIRPEDLTKKKHTAKGLYVGIVVGKDRYTSAITIRKLRLELDMLCKKYRVVKVFGRPVTDDGLKLMRKAKFKNVIDNAEPEMNVVCRKLWE
jgi:hypothetical protein